MKSLLIMFVLVAVSAFAEARQSAKFESSDGNWADREVLLKGRDFKSILFTFERYKLKCGVEDVYLIRTTKPGKKADISDPKWKVPFNESALEDGVSYYPPVSMRDHCFNQPNSRTELVEFRERADRRLEYWLKLDSK